MKKYSSVYDLAAELKARGYKTTPEVDCTFEPKDDPDASYLTCADGRLYEYPKYEFYVIRPKTRSWNNRFS